MVCAEGASAFVISDIRVEGLMRTEPGTVFSHLPFRTGDEYTPDMGTRAIHSLYRSGLFKDVSLSQDGDVLVVHIVERPAVATIETHGIKAFDKDAVETSLRDVGMPRAASSTRRRLTAPTRSCAASTSPAAITA